ncbi:phage tail protein [Rhizobium sp. BK602]|uniref:phage tail protein n=1 Tax=Rhizobium sp. BK602 TaxID=2586986 RepID=UPI0018212953|nr:phage tail protein [Rhizobium sp. BK602]MBB3607354.1 hypothetical protein [Rhizobium sp. BK602]
MADAAHAEPISLAISAISGFLTSIGAIGKLVLTVALNVGLSLIEKALAKKEQPRQAGTKLEISMGDDHPMSFVMGSYATAGRRKYAGTWGEDGKTPNAYFTDVIEIGSLPNHAGERGLTSVWIDDQEVGVLWEEPHPDGRGFPVAQYRVGSKDYLWIRFLDGTQSAPDAFLTAKFGSEPDRPWKSTMIGLGCQIVILTARYNTDLFSGVPAGLYQPHPVRLYDLRKDSSVGGSGVHRWTDPSTWEASSNPAVMIYNLARGVYYGSEWVYGGQNIAAFCLPAASWMAAANACDAPVTLDGGASEPAFRAGYDIQCDQQPLDVISELLKGCNGRMAEVGGIFKMLVGAPGGAVYSFSDDDIIVTEEQDYQPFPTLSDTYNAIEATYPEPTEKWATKDAPGRYNTDLETEDGNRRLPAQIELPAVPFANQVQRVGLAMIQDYRRFRVHQISLPPDAYPLEPNDVVSWSSARNGYAEKKFLVVKVEPQPNFLVVVTLKEVDPADYDWHSGLQLPTATGWIGPITPPSQPMTGWAVEPATVKDAGGIDRRPAIKISCAADMDDVERVWVQVRLKETSDVVFDSDSTRYQSPFSWIISGQWMLPDTDYEVRGRYIPKSTRATDWSTWLTVKTPNILISTADVLDNSITANKIADAAVIASKIMDEAVTNLKLADAAVSTAKLQVSAVTAEVLANSAVISSKLADGAVTAAKLADAMIEATKFASTIKPVEIVSALPATGNVEGRTVYLTTDDKLYRYTGSAWTAAVAAVDVSGTLVSSQIADGAITNSKLAALAIDATKFASTIKPVEIVSTLPTSDNVEGRTVYLTTDDKLYRYTGSAWTAATAATDIAGQIVGTQISDGAISTPKLAAGSVTANALAAGAVTADKIAANTITAGQIAAGAIGATQIAANAVTAKSLVLQDWENLIPDNQMQSSASWPVLTNSVVNPATSQAFTSKGAIDYGYVSGSSYVQILQSQPFAIVAGQPYLASVQAIRTSGTKFGLWIRVHWLGADGNLLSPDTYVTICSYGTADGGTADGVQTFTANITPPATAYGAVIKGYIHRTYTDGNVSIGGLSWLRRQTASLIVDGSVIASKIAADAVTATAIATGAVTADAIAANAVTAGKIAANAVTAGTIAAGAVSASQIAADAITSDKLASNSVTTDALAVGSGKNLLQNASFSAGMDCWTYGSSGTVPSLSVRIRTTSETYAGKNNPTLMVFQNSGPTSGSYYTDVRWLRSDADTLAVDNLKYGVSCTAGETLEATAYVSAHRCIVDLRIEWRTSDGSVVSYAGPSSNSANSSSSTDPDTWPRLRVAGVAPTGSVCAGVHIRKRDTNSGSTDSYMFVNKPMLCRIPAGATEATPWSNGDSVLITAGGIVASAVTANAIAANAVTAGKIAANAVTAGTIAAGAVTAATIAAGTITGDKLAANTIGAAQIAANSITAKSLILTDFSNIVDNGWSQGDLTSWTVTGQLSYANDASQGDASGWILGANGVFCAVSQFYPVVPGQQYAFEVWVKNSDGTYAAVVYACTKGASSETITYTQAAATSTMGSWVLLRGKVTIPSGQTRCAMGLQIGRPSTGGAGALWSRPMMRKAINAELIVDGAVTANAIAANAISAGMIQAGAISTDKLVVGGVDYTRIAKNSIGQRRTQGISAGPWGDGTLRTIYTWSINNDNPSAVLTGFTVTLYTNASSGTGHMYLINTTTGTQLLDLTVSAPGTNTYAYNMIMEDVASAGVHSYAIQVAALTTVSGILYQSWTLR